MLLRALPCWGVKGFYSIYHRFYIGCNAVCFYLLLPSNMRPPPAWARPRSMLNYRAVSIGLLLINR